MSITRLFEQPETLNLDSLNELRNLVAQYPYCHAARLLMLKNMFLLQDNNFEQELKKAALLVPNRRELFNMVHGLHYALHQEKKQTAAPPTKQPADRTSMLLDSFLEHQEGRKGKNTDPKTDYMGFLMQGKTDVSSSSDSTVSTPNDRTSSLIDSFISQKQERLILSNSKDQQTKLEETPQEFTADNSQNEDTYLTETLAKIYIQQGKYERAVEIISKLNLNNPKKSAYFADQLRFLQKLIVNSKHEQESN